LLIAPTGECLDLIEIAFAHVNRLYAMDGYRRQQLGITMPRAEPIDDLNKRFPQHNLGFEFIDGRILRREESHVHEEVVKPAFFLLRRRGLEAAQDDFSEAFGFYRGGPDYLREAVASAAKAPYKSPVGPGPVRDLYGTMVDWRAREAWLIATNGFRKGGREISPSGSESACCRCARC
jgi:hypothetical protein